MKCEIVPRNLRPLEQRDILTLDAGGEFRPAQPRTVDQLELADSRDVVDAEQRVDLDFGAGFFPRFAGRARQRRQISRASWRARVCQYVSTLVAPVSLQKKTTTLGRPKTKQQ